MVRGGKFYNEEEAIIYEQEQYCNNPNCTDYNKTVDVIKHKMN